MKPFVAMCSICLGDIKTQCGALPRRHLNYIQIWTKKRKYFEWIQIEICQAFWSGENCVDKGFVWWPPVNAQQLDIWLSEAFANVQITEATTLTIVGGDGCYQNSLHDLAVCLICGVDKRLILVTHAVHSLRMSCMSMFFWFVSL